MTAYLMTAERHAQIVEALDGLFTETPTSPLGGVAVWRLGGSHAPHKALAMLKAMKPVEPVAYGWIGSDGHIRDCISPETHEVIEGSYTLPLYTLGDTPPAPITQEDGK